MLTNDLIAETYTAITAQNDIEERIQGIGANLLSIRPGGGGRGGFGPANAGGNQNALTLSDVDAIESESQYITHIAPQASGRYQVIASGNNINTTVLGITSDYASVRGTSMAKGSFLTIADDGKISRVAVLGSQGYGDCRGRIEYATAT